MRRAPSVPAPRFAPHATQRVVIEDVTPEINGGRYPIKRTVGESVAVSARIFADGHDVLAARLRYRKKGARQWTDVPMSPQGNDWWQASFVVTANARFEYTVEGWIDRFASWQADLAKRVQVGQEVSSELLEGAALVTAASRTAGPDRRWLSERASLLASNRPVSQRTEAALDPALQAAMSRCADREPVTVYDRVLEVTVDRERARFGAWYEMFPRSAGTDPTRSATFREAAARLDDIAAMGFDVVYLPPIHPIGQSYRKGPNNSLTAGPRDPGSPWAIGNELGGHDAVEPSLGTLADFRGFLEAAKTRGLEVALDIAFQCSPDHPYVKEHPEWFRHRPDGSIKYAENPPKKYQDIYPLNFDTPDWKNLWQELRRVILFWTEQGVRMFRVDNPHTKPIHFWEWLIDSVQSKYPDVVFLSEAFTRPAVMYALAKVGFTQSYSYFTWRNTKSELTQYFTELTQTEVREYYRPNLFANTPDILHEYLQTGGRAAFQVRLVLAATLGASYGIYSGFELCDGNAVPGTEEYHDSEKYQIRVRDWNQPGNIKDLVATINAIRRQNPALHSDRSLRFFACTNDRIISYAKSTDDLSNVIVVVVNLDAHHAQEGHVHVPIETLSIAPSDPYEVHDLLSNTGYLWQGESNYVRLDPAVCPAHVFRLRRRLRTERDVDAFA
ncbi:MAG: alpha-1,4-glucan--maltose-1-phosphate maltosyltransferase [Nitrospirota bacterium]